MIAKLECLVLFFPYYHTWFALVPIVVFFANYNFPRTNNLGRTKSTWVFMGVIPLILLYLFKLLFKIKLFLFFCFWKNSHPPTYYPPLFPTNLFTYIFKLKIDSSPSSYSTYKFKCVILILTHMFIPHLFIYLLALPPSYLPTL